MSTTTNTATPDSMGIFKTSLAMARLWDKASEHMTEKELVWFADGAAEQVGNDLRALSSFVENTACLVSSDETSGAFQDSDSTSKMLFNLHNQIDAIAGMAEISEQANWFARRALKGGAA